MDRAIATWLSQPHPSPPSPSTLSLAHHLRKSRYTQYDTMLLLPPFPSSLPYSQASLAPLIPSLAAHLKVTHIAISRPIPASVPASSPSLISYPPTPNHLRAPISFEPVYGDFGPATLLPHPSPSSSPSPHDFSAAFWVSAKQNGIIQTWAPRWTMFSRGNISEKARLLQLDSVREAVGEGGSERDEDGEAKGCAAVDLYVGIGYFAFSYLKAGVKVVLGWEINGWSVEGLRRGAAKNGWGCEVVREGDEQGEGIGDRVRLVVFEESNERARRRVEAMRGAGALPRVRHVNCGLLPSSRASWDTAVDVLDPEWGGWVHVHENFAVAEIETRSEGVREAFQEMVRERGRVGEVVVEGVNRLKSYAPGVMHCVIDLYVPGLG